MMIKSSRFHLAIVAIALLLTSLWIASAKWSGQADGSSHLSDAATATVKTKAQSARNVRPVAKALTVEAAMMIPPHEWETRFKTEYQDVDSEIRSEVVMLAGELKDSITGGLDPKGEEARAYGETILILLSETTMDK